MITNNNIGHFALLLMLGYFMVPTSDAFVTTSVQKKKRTNSIVVAVQPLYSSVPAIAGKEFQLEEREDRDTENTRIFLNTDGSVTLQDTDGPKYKTYQGLWSLSDEQEKPFRMRIDRVFEGGMDAKQSTDIGIFDYQVKREYWGNMQIIGGRVEIEGVIHLLDNSGDGISDYEVGYFALIDSNEED